MSLTGGIFTGAGVKDEKKCRSSLKWVELGAIPVKDSRSDSLGELDTRALPFPSSRLGSMTDGQEMKCLHALAVRCDDEGEAYRRNSYDSMRALCE